MRYRWAERVGGVLFAGAMVNFLAFIVHCAAIGGSADHGKQVAERYYVGDHGRYTEVTAWQWQAMRVHEVSVLVTFSLAVFVAGPLFAYAERIRR